MEKLCIDCQNSDLVRGNNLSCSAVCMRPDPKTGYPVGNLCDRERNPVIKSFFDIKGNGFCGRDAQYFKPTIHLSQEVSEIMDRFEKSTKGHTYIYCKMNQTHMISIENRRKPLPLDNEYTKKLEDFFENVKFDVIAITLLTKRIRTYIF